jgi:peptidylprolyl isomerase
MTTAQTGNTISVHYTGKYTNGTVFDSSVGAEPLQFKLGSGQVIPGFDAGILGMAIGDKKTIHIPAEQAYGAALPENVINIPREQFPTDIPIEVGSQLNLHQDGSAEVIPVTITAANDQHVTLDANHPMAGHDLVFELELIAIEA